MDSTKGQEETQKEMKRALRKQLNSLLVTIPQQELERQGELVGERVLGHPWFKESTNICVYLHMGAELPTSSIVSYLLNPQNGKKCFIPHILPGNQMKMVRVEGKEDLDTFVANKWGILEPPNEREDVYSSGGHLDLILCPGLGFDNNKQRLGRGKGYYDRYIQRANSLSTPPKLIGIALKEQIVESVPTDSHDFPMDDLIFDN